MAHYAELDANNIVLRVIVVGNGVTTDETGNENEKMANDFLHANGITGRFVRTSYNSVQNVYYDPETHMPTNKPAFRKNFAGVGMIYDADRDAFIFPKPPDDPDNPNRFVFDENKGIWVDTLFKAVRFKGVTRI